MQIGIGRMLIGLACKLSLVPFHLWTPDVYEGAPAPGAAFLATASKEAVFDVLLRLYQISPVSYTHLDVYKRQAVSWCRSASA